MMSTHRAIIAVSVRTQVVTRRRVSAPGTAAMSAVAPAARLSDVRQRSRARAALTARASACSRGIAGIAGLSVVPGPGGRHTSRGRVSVVTHAAGAKKKRSPEEIRARRELREQREAREAEEAELAAFEAEEAAARSGAGKESGDVVAVEAAWMRAAARDGGGGGGGGPGAGADAQRERTSPPVHHALVPVQGAELATALQRAQAKRRTSTAVAAVGFTNRLEKRRQRKRRRRRAARRDWRHDLGRDGHEFRSDGR